MRKPEERGFLRRRLQISKGRAGLLEGEGWAAGLILTMYCEVAVEEETKARGQSGSSGATQE